MPDIHSMSYAILIDYCTCLTFMGLIINMPVSHDMFYVMVIGISYMPCYGENEDIGPARYENMRYLNYESCGVSFW